MFFINKPLVTDYDRLVELWEASVRATHHFLADADIVLFRELIREKYLHLVDLYCLRNDDGNICGFCGVSGSNLEMLFIDPPAMGMGAGKTLLLYAIHELLVCRVDVNEQNPKAIGFYEHFGFKTTGRSELDGTGKPYPLLHMQLL
jgi:putative acetyltransferase